MFLFFCRLSDWTIQPCTWPIRRKRRKCNDLRGAGAEGRCKRGFQNHEARALCGSRRIKCVERLVGSVGSKAKVERASTQIENINDQRRVMDAGSNDKAETLQCVSNRAALRRGVRTAVCVNSAKPGAVSDGGAAKRVAALVQHQRGVCDAARH